jgi:hypothetical protein
MSKVYHIKHLRLIKDLDTYLNKGQMTPNLKSYMHKNSINKKKFYDFFDGVERAEVKKIYNRFVLAYQKETKNNSEIDLQLRYDLEDSYFTIIENFLTKDSSYYFPSILKKYRPNINPVRALYFDVQEVDVQFKPDDENHQFIYDRFKSKEFYKKLITDIEKDLNSLYIIENKYKSTKKNHHFFTLPISFYHIQDMIKDMKKWLKVFIEFYNKVNNIRDDYA